MCLEIHFINNVEKGPYKLNIFDALFWLFELWFYAVLIVGIFLRLPEIEM